MVPRRPWRRVTTVPRRMASRSPTPGQGQEISRHVVRPDEFASALRPARGRASAGGRQARRLEHACARVPHAGEGIYDWLKHREPRWASLAIIHRLDKDTSGVMVFGKTTLANRSLTEQFAGRAVRKKYLLLTDRPVPAGERTRGRPGWPARATATSAARAASRPRPSSSWSDPARGHAVRDPRRGRAAHRAHAPDPRPRRGVRLPRSSATRCTAARRSRASACTRRSSRSSIRRAARP